MKSDHRPTAELISFRAISLSGGCRPRLHAPTIVGRRPAGLRINEDSHVNRTSLFALKTGAAPLALAIAVATSPACAQDSTGGSVQQTLPGAPGTAAQQDNAAADAEGDQTIVVTGSILRRTDTETPSPVTTVTTENLEQRGISTVQEGLQTLASNNGPALTNSFSANGAFAAGASAVSLRGLSTNSTLVLFDGMRAAYYPLADDGTRNFVDLNTIPDDIIERVEVLRDGASSSYGADAIAGVVNVITKRQVTGVTGRAEAGTTSIRPGRPIFRPRWG